MFKSSRIPLRLTLATLLAVPTLSATGCLLEGVEIDDSVVIDTVEREETGEARFEIGDINEDCSDTDPDDGIHYSQRIDSSGNMFCLIAMDWEKLLISMSEVKAGVEEGIDEELGDSVPTDGVKIEFTDVAIEELSIQLVKDSGGGDEVVLGFDAMVYYLANVNLDDVGGLVQIDWPVPNETNGPDSPRVQLLGSDGVGQANEDSVLDYLNQAYEDETDVNGQGHAEIEFAYSTPEDLLALSGSTLVVDFTVAITGEGSYSVSRGFGTDEAE